MRKKEERLGGRRESATERSLHRQIHKEYVWKKKIAVILCVIDSTSCCKHSSQILVCIDMTWRFVSCTSIMPVSCSSTSKACSTADITKWRTAVRARNQWRILILMKKIIRARAANLVNTTGVSSIAKPIKSIFYLSAPENSRRRRWEKLACSKVRKVDSENRTFKDEWTDQYMFILPAASSKLLCLICCETVALVKTKH